MMWVTGLVVPTGAPGRILIAVRRSDLVAVMSWELAARGVEVFTPTALPKRLADRP